MMVGTKTNGSEVAFYPPDDWWKDRGDVCIAAVGFDLCFVKRDTAGYLPVPVYEWPPRDRPPQRAKLSIADAEAIAEQFNLRSLGISQEEANRVLASSMQAQNAPAKPEGAPC